MISEAAKAELKEKYNVLGKQYLEFRNAAAEGLERDNQLLSMRIIEGLQEVAKEIAEAEGYTLILGKIDNVIVYFDETMDITEQVIKIYNERYQTGQ